MLKQIKKFIQDERGELDLAPLKTEFSEFKKLQDQFLREWESMKGPIDELNKFKKEGKGISELTLKLEKQEQIIGKQEDTLELIKAEFKKLDGWKSSQDESKEKVNREKKAFEKYIRTGQVTEGISFLQGDRIQSFDKKDLSIGVPAEGGILVRPEFATEIYGLLREMNSLRQYCDVRMIGTSKMEILERSTVNQVVGATEKQARPLTTSLAFAPIRYIEAFDLYANPAITQQMIDDSFLDIESYIKSELALDFAVQEGANNVNGTGTNQAKGFLTYPAGTGLGQIEQIASGEAADLTSASYDGLVACQNSLHEFYEANAMWCFNRKTRGKIRTVKLDGRPVWAPGYSLEGGNTVLGDEYFIMGSMPDVAANSISVAYGDWKNAYRIVDRFGVRLIRDNLTNKPFIMLYTTFRVGGDILKWDALKLMKTA